MKLDKSKIVDRGRKLGLQKGCPVKWGLTLNDEGAVIVRYKFEGADPVEIRAEAFKETQ